jgi:hypothetical protein
VQDALSYGNSCIQSNPHPVPRRTLAARIPPGPAWPKPPESEDCLFLNVWTRGLSDRGKRPVIVWLHGGAFISGSASEPVVDGTNLARRANVVCVGINHRLNVFGYWMIGSIGVHLSRDPALQDRLRAHPRLIGAALEEFLRLYTPYRGFARTANHDTGIRGCPIRSGKARIKRGHPQRRTLSDA